MRVGVEGHVTIVHEEGTENKRRQQAEVDHAPTGTQQVCNHIADAHVPEEREASAREVSAALFTPEAYCDRWRFRARQLPAAPRGG